MLQRKHLEACPRIRKTFFFWFSCIHPFLLNSTQIITISDEGGSIVFEHDRTSNLNLCFGRICATSSNIFLPYTKFQERKNSQNGHPQILKKKITHVYKI
jgi:hypothetical protein